MDIPVARRSLLPAWALGLVALAGCAGTGEVFHLHVQAGHPVSGEYRTSGDGLAVAVTVFEDLRSESGRLGTWIDLWGGERLFQVADGSPGEVTARIMVETLNSRGWRAGLVMPDQAEPAADVLLSGRIQTLSVDADGSFGSTQIVATSQILVEAVNKADGSTVRMTLSGTRSQGVFWFEPEDAQELISRVLTETFDKLVSETKVEGRALHVK